MMKHDLFATLPGNLKEIFGIIGAEADGAGVHVFLVGGMVRDLLLGRPGTDIDVVVEGDGPSLARRLARRFGVKPLFHEKFRTAAMPLDNGMDLDVVTARRETYARGGALPDIVPGALEDDLYRRDFTVNAMAAGLNGGDFGVLRDDLKGFEDLESELIRVMHDNSFRDDPTRILRAARYAVRFGFHLEALTQDLLDQAVMGKALETLTAPRYFLEFRRTLEEKDPAPVLDLLSAWEAVRFVPYSAENRERLLAAGGSWTERLAALLGGWPRSRAEQLLVAFNIPRSDRENVCRALQA